MAKGTPNLDCAHAWLNFTSSLAGQCSVVHVTGYAGANPAALKECLTPEEMEAIHADDPAYIEGLAFPMVLEEPVKYVNTWNAVKTAP